MRDSFPNVMTNIREPKVQSGEKILSSAGISAGGGVQDLCIQMVDMNVYAKKENLEPILIQLGQGRNDSFHRLNVSKNRNSTTGRSNQPSVVSMQMFKANKKRPVDLNMVQAPTQP